MRETSLDNTNFCLRKKNKMSSHSRINPISPSQIGSKFSVLSNLKLSLYILKLPIRRFDVVPSALIRAVSSAVAWLLGPLRDHRLRHFERRFFTPRGYHLLAAAYILFKLLQQILKRFTGRARARQIRTLKAQLRTADSYEAWTEAATALDALEGRTLPAWVHTRGVAGLRERAAALRRARDEGDLPAVCFLLRQDGTRSVGQLMAAAAEEVRVHNLTPPPIVEMYVNEVKEALGFVAASPLLPLDDRLAFMRELRHAYGRTALVLSGGGSFGFFHFGVIRALFDAGLLPRVVSGSSAGAIGAALLCTRSNAELQRYLHSFVECKDLDFYGAPKGLWDFARHLVSKGTLHAAEEYVPRLQRLLGAETTFAEAYARSGRVLNIAVVAADTREPCRLLNYLTAPNVVIWSAVACSSAFPLLFAPQELLCKDVSGRLVPHHPSGTAGPSGCLRRWCDGSLEEDLPMRGLSEMFSINFFLCSQTNPWLVPVLNAQAAVPLRLRRLGEYELKHRTAQLLHIWPNSRILKLISQPWTGDLTFLMPADLFPVLKSATNFTTAEIELVMQEGRRSVWKKLAAVKAACAVEYLIDEELQGLAAMTRAAERREERRVRFSTSSIDAAASSSNENNSSGGAFQGDRGRKGIPSWLDLKTLGLPSSESGDDIMPLAGPGTPRGSLGSLRDLQVFGDEIIQGEASERAGSTPEGGVDAWRDLTALTMQIEGLDIVAP